MKQLNTGLPVSKAIRAFGLATTGVSLALISYKCFTDAPVYPGPSVDMTNKVVVVTEGVSSYNNDFMSEMLKRNARLVVGCSNMAQCNNVREDLIKRLKVNSDRIECRNLSMTSLVSVRRFAAGLLADYPKVDRVLIQSPTFTSRSIKNKRTPTSDGYEYHLVTDFLSVHLLSQLLLDRIEASRGRLILVADESLATKTQKDYTVKDEAGNDERIDFTFDNVNWDQTTLYKPVKAFGQTQWFVQLLANELASRSKAGTVFLTDPQTSVSTNFSFDYSALGWKEYAYRALIFVNSFLPRKTAAASTFCAIGDFESGKLPLSTNCFYQGFNPMPPPVHDLTTVQKSIVRFGDKWTRLDDHPTALPIPVREYNNDKTGTMHADGNVTLTSNIC